MAFGYYRSWTVQAAQVPSTQTDFPVLVSVTHADLKSVANGGHVQETFGPRPYADSGLTSALFYELEFYDPVNGILVMHVKIPSLSNGSVIYLAYGDATLTTNGSSTSTWDANYKGVYHLPNGTTLTVLDSTSNGNNGTKQGNVSARAGQIDGGADFDGSGDYISLASNPNVNDLTIECWSLVDNFTQQYDVINFQNDSIVIRRWPHSSTLDVDFIVVTSNGTKIVTYNTELFTGTWYYMVGTYDRTVGKFYVNGTVFGTTFSDTGNTVTGSTNHIGIHNNGSSNALDGAVDEVRISNIARSADWITTQYNNQSAPGTFAVLGSEQVVSAALSRKRSHFLLMFPV